MLRQGSRIESSAYPRSLLRDLSNCVLFDYLIGNTDRWSGGNILALGKGGPLIFLDNAAGFTPWRRDKTLDERLAPLCRFRAATVAALRAVGPAATPARRLSALLADSLAGDALAPVIGQTQLSATDARLAALLDHVQRCIDTQGKDRVLSL